MKNVKEVSLQLADIIVISILGYVLGKILNGLIPDTFWPKANE